MVEDYGENKRWIFFCEDETIVNLPGLVQVLNKYDARKVWWKKVIYLTSYSIIVMYLVVHTWLRQLLTAKH